MFSASRAIWIGLKKNSDVNLSCLRSWKQIWSRFDTNGEKNIYPVGAACGPAWLVVTDAISVISPAMNLPRSHLTTVHPVNNMRQTGVKSMHAHAVLKLLCTHTHLYARHVYYVHQYTCTARIKLWSSHYDAIRAHRSVMPLIAISEKRVMHSERVLWLHHF